jgi:hypothetical protein
MIEFDFEVFVQYQRGDSSYSTITLGGRGRVAVLEV